MKKTIKLLSALTIISAIAMSFSSNVNTDVQESTTENNGNTTVEQKEGILIGYTDQNHAIVSPNDGGGNIIIKQQGIQVIHPNPPMNVYYLEVTITKCCNGGKIVIERDLRKR